MGGRFHLSIGPGSAPSQLVQARFPLGAYLTNRFLI